MRTPRPGRPDNEEDDPARPSPFVADRGSKALTVAIAGALAAPMAAQAVDFTISGQVSRTLFVNDSAMSTSGEIRDNNGATRVRANGHSVLEDGSTLGIQFEYGVDAGVTLRHANVQYTGEFGRITFGQGSEAGDGSAGLGPGVGGIGAGQDGTSKTAYLDKKLMPMTLGGAFFSSLDGGGRNNMVRYDTPAIGPLSAAVSVGNGDSVSGQLALSSDFGGTVFAAKVATHMVPGSKDTTSASVGITLPSGLAVGGAWGRGNDHLGMPAMRGFAIKYVGGFESADTFQTAVAAIDGNEGIQTSTPISDLTAEQVEAYQEFVDDNLCNKTVLDAEDMDGATVGDLGSLCVMVPYGGGGSPEMSVDPSYFRAGIGYTFGNTTVAASWYNSEDFVMDGSEGTAFGVGASHALPKVGATVHVSVQNYEVRRPMMPKMDETVFQLGTLVTF